jgi:UDP-glucuronate 4-epimerase
MNMGKVLVTGCAGFIGSRLCEKLLDLGEEVIGIDSFKSNYARWIKERNLAVLRQSKRFTLLEQDLLKCDLHTLLQDVTFVYHHAALPGVRTSWGCQFRDYVDDNILATQTLLEALKDSSVQKMIYASSSSVYGGMTGPVDEDAQLRPVSPYGVTKLSAEQLCQLYAQNFHIPVISLRYFTVFGPRQRPDMAMHKFIASILQGTPIPIYGDGEQTRDFTFVDDVVRANLAAAASKHTGCVMNIGGGCRSSINGLIRIIEQYVGKKAKRNHLPEQPGDPRHTWANIQRAKTLIGFDPKFDLEQGIYLEIEDLKQLYKI